MKVVTFNLRCDTPHDGENRWEFRKGLVLDIGICRVMTTRL